MSPEIKTYDASRLYSTLQNTGLAVKDNALYQVIYNLIHAIIRLNDIINSGSGGSGGGSGGGGSVINIIDSRPLGLDGFDGVDGEDGFPGIQGIRGLTGFSGAPGIDGFDGQDGEDGLPGIPGVRGADGARGVNGNIGPPGLDGLDGDDSPFIPFNPTYIFNGAYTVLPSSATGTQNDWAPGLVYNTLIEWTGSSALTVTGLGVGYKGQIVVFKNSGTSNAFFTNQSGSSIAANRFTNVVTSGLTPVAAKGYVAYIHNGTNWILINHQQGSYIDIAYNSGDFTAQAGTWTVTSGQLITNAYKVDGNQVFHKIKILSSTLSASPNYLDVLLPYTCARSEYANLCWGSDGAGVYIILFPEYDTTHNTVVRFYKFNNTAWTIFAHISLSHNYTTS